MRRWWTVGLLMMMMVLAACGASETPAADDSTAPVTGETEAGADSEGAAGATTEPEPEPEPDPEADPEAGEETSEADLTGAELVIYSGRSESLVGPLIELFEEQSGIDAQVRYGETAEMAATILEEGANSPADVYYGQDAGALGALAQEGRLQPLPEDVLSQVDERFRAPGGEWVGATGRARVVVYNTEALSAEELPASIVEFTDPQWEGRLGWAPTNGSFQAFVTALRASLGEDAAREWLEGIQANNPTVYANNTAIVEAVINGEIDAGFVNHYYLLRMRAESGGDLPAENHYFEGTDIGNLINVAGAGILDTATNTEAADAFVRFLLSEEAQSYFRDETHEYPLIEGVEAGAEARPLDQIPTPAIDLNTLQDLEGTLELLSELGIL
mgnify:CR=1 FL=1